MENADPPEVPGVIVNVVELVNSAWMIALALVWSVMLATSVHPSAGHEQQRPADGAPGGPVPFAVPARSGVLAGAGVGAVAAVHVEAVAVGAVGAAGGVERGVRVLSFGDVEHLPAEAASDQHVSSSIPCSAGRRRCR